MKKAIFGLAALALVSVGCGGSQGKTDAPHDGLNGADNSPAHIINMPDTFMNLAFKCNGTDGIYTHTREAAPVVIPNDDNCKDKTVSK